MNDASTQRRYWLPRFSLRTLFVVTALIAAWLGYYMNWIRERHEADRDIDSRRSGCCFIDFVEGGNKDLPWSLRVLGEPPHYGFKYLRRDPKEDLEVFHRRAKELESLFPESRIFVLDMAPTNLLPDESGPESSSNLAR